MMGLTTHTHTHTHTQEIKVASYATMSLPYVLLTDSDPCFGVHRMHLLGRHHMHMLGAPQACKGGIAGVYWRTPQVCTEGSTL